MKEAQSILVVDDDNVILDLCRDILTDSGYNVDAVDSAEEALQKVNVVEYDIFIIDVRLSNIGGLDLLEVLDMRFPDSAKIIMTGYISTDVIIEALRKGADDFLSKPFGEDSLIAAVQRSIEKVKTRQEVAELKQISELYDLYLALGTKRNIDLLLTAILDSALRLVNADSGSIMLVDEKTKKLFLKASRGIEERYIPVEGVTPKGTISGIVIEEKRPIIISKNETDFLFKSFLKKTQPVSSICIPMKLENDMLGIMNLNRSVEKDEFSERDVSLLSLFVTHAVFVINNEKLYDELKTTNIHLSTEKKKLESVVDSLHLGAIVVDNENNVVMCNPAFKSIIGAKQIREECNLIENLPNEKVRDMIISVIETLKSSETEMIVKDYDVFLRDTAMNFRVTAKNVYIEENADVVARIIMVEDATKYNYLLKVSAWREIARKLAHEISNVLTPIQLSADRISRIAEKCGECAPKDTMVECSGEISRGIADMKNLLNEFSYFARLPAPVPVKMDINAVIEELIRDCRMSFPLIEINAQLNAGPWIVSVDITLIRNCFLNLIKNSAEAMLSGGKLIVRTSKEGDRVKIEFEDTGSGIKEEIIDKIFSPYFTTKTTGTGLGLPIVQKIISDHGGEIKVSSVVGKGTKFTVFLLAG